MKGENIKKALLVVNAQIFFASKDAIPLMN